MARRTRSDGPAGFVVVNKEPGWTSHDVVAKLRGILRQRRTGHAGTLDPSATGVLVVGVGKATRLLRYLQTTDKTYDGTLVLGSTTDTLDADGQVTATFDMSAITPEQVRLAASALTGDLLQVPPMVSAIKIDGQRLHDLARQGLEVDRPARPVRVDRFDVSAIDDGRFSFVVACSTGTYVRSLVDDLGRSLGGGAHVTSLRRTAVGTFTLDQALRLEEIEALVQQSGSVEDSGVLLSPADALEGFETLTAGAEEQVAVSRGTVFGRSRLAASGPGPFAVVDQGGALLAVYEAFGSDQIKPSVVLVDLAGQQ